MNGQLSEFGAILIVILVGFLPNEVWRVLGVALGRGLDDDSLLMRWIRAVATALLAAVVAHLVLVPSGALVALPLWLRLAAVGSGIAGFLVGRRSVLAGVLTAEVVLVAGAWWLGVGA
ncbi:AzlD domain-containing protein [Ancylobacter sp. MQZ15Z-1]|uniref:AzlD domain-containing protein n=1 Tax=Ancylobacter mangrovi TaxID=2972472 RepID=A0A9X2PK24_9HYPH|nr:AzlD domain-containing protein [Ancylobacter mangrovi]MCS0496667.1 AzlD domain-containing protein [Ancylobacter mangrovi]